MHEHYIDCKESRRGTHSNWVSYRIFGPTRQNTTEDGPILSVAYLGSRKGEAKGGGQRGDRHTA